MRTLFLTLAMALFGREAAALDQCAHDAAPSLHTLLAALPRDIAGPLAPPLSSVRVVMAELDGAGATEAVLSASRPGTEHGPIDTVWVFSRENGAWTLRASDSYEMNRASGNVDARGLRGNVLVEGVRIDARSCRELLRVERLRTNFEATPGSFRSFALLRYDGASLRYTFGCYTLDGDVRARIAFVYEATRLALRVTDARAHTTALFSFDGERFTTRALDVCQSWVWTRP